MQTLALVGIVAPTFFVRLLVVDVTFGGEKL